jgi:uncharacterized protein (TIGR03435 family)
MKYATSIIGAGLFAVMTLFVAAVPSAQRASATLDEPSRRAVVEASAKMLRERYVFPDIGDQAAHAIESALREGAYDGLDQPAAFAQRLTEDLRVVAKDKHLRVTAPGPPVGTPLSARPRAEGGVARADILDGNVGYIEVVGFPPPSAFTEPVNRAMAALQNTRALIVDVRRNGGGSPVAVSYLVSYFLRRGERVHLNTFINRIPGTDTFRSQEFWSESTPFSYAGKRVFILTSGRTFSGGEEFAYDMQVMGLAQIVGDTTGGGANPGRTLRLAGGLAMFVPGGRASNPITGTNWEGVGVVPDVPVPSANALTVALERLGVSPAHRDIDVASQSRAFESNESRRTAAPTQSELPSFEAASIKRNRSGATGVGATTLLFEPNGRFKAVNEPLWRLIAEAYRSNYQLRRFEIEGIPRSMDGDRFDVDAVPQGTPGFSQQRLMLQRLLADRFKLAVHRETREMPVYALVKARADGRLGERLTPSDVDCSAVRAGGLPPGATPGQPQPCMMIFGPGRLVSYGMTVTQLAEMGLARSVLRPVIDRTELTGSYTWTLEWAPDEGPDAGTTLPSLMTALVEQLGLKLEPARGPVEMLVIDHVESPTPD